MDIKVIPKTERKIYSAEIEVNLTSLQDHYIGQKLIFWKEFKIHNVAINFCVYDTNFNATLKDRSENKTLYVIVNNAPWIECDIKSLSVSLEKWTNRTVEGHNCKFTKIKPSNGRTDKQLYFDWTQLFCNKSKLVGEKVTKVVGTFTIRVEAGFKHLLKEKFVGEFCKLDVSTDSEDIVIVCDDGEKIPIAKDLLCKISDIFQTMLENPKTLESQNNCVELKNISSETIKAFKNIMSNDTINQEDLSVELLVFADRYNIQPLVRFCKDNLKNNISKDNFMDIVKAADVIADKDLLQATANFAALNIGSFEKDQEIMNFIKSNPECFAKVWELMMFK